MRIWVWSRMLIPTQDQDQNKGADAMNGVHASSTLVTLVNHKVV